MQNPNLELRLALSEIEAKQKWKHFWANAFKHAHPEFSAQCAKKANRLKAIAAELKETRSRSTVLAS